MSRINESNLARLIQHIKSLIETKQNKLTAGDNVVIDNNKISVDLEDYPTGTQVKNTLKNYQKVLTNSTLLGTINGIPFYFGDDLTITVSGGGNFYSEGLEFETCTGGYACLGRGTCTDSNIVIPPTYNGLPVTEIGAFAFDCDNNLISIVIPPSVTLIDDVAFSNCGNLKRVDLSQHTSVPILVSDTEETFDGLTSDSQIKVPSNLIGEWKTATNWDDFANLIVTEFTNTL